MKRTRAVDTLVYCARIGRALNSLGIRGKCALSQEGGYIVAWIQPGRVLSSLEVRDKCADLDWGLGDMVMASTVSEWLGLEFRSQG